jgi:hypothetical protein
VGGWLGEACPDSGPVNRSTFLRGVGFPGPSKWLYARNDPFYSIPHSRASFDAFQAAGGSGTYHEYQRAPELNGHFLLNDTSLWGADVDAWPGEPSMRPDARPPD